MKSAVILTDDELRACCAEWQSRLRLQDWSVVIKRVRSADYGGKSVAGDVRVFLEKRAAIIRITEPDDYVLQANPDYEIPQDMEITVVHELLHLHTWAFTTGRTLERLEEAAEEQAIDALSRALVALKREAA